jgi:hypothetical protein
METVSRITFIEEDLSTAETAPPGRGEDPLYLILRQASQEPYPFQLARQAW